MRPGGHSCFPPHSTTCSTPIRSCSPTSPSCPPQRDVRQLEMKRPNPPCYSWRCCLQVPPASTAWSNGGDISAKASNTGSWTSSHDSSNGGSAATIAPRFSPSSSVGSCRGMRRRSHSTWWITSHGCTASVEKQLNTDQTDRAEARGSDPCPSARSVQSVFSCSSRGAAERYADPQLRNASMAGNAVRPRSVMA